MAARRWLDRLLAEARRVLLRPDHPASPSDQGKTTHTPATPPQKLVVSSPPSSRATQSLTAFFPARLPGRSLIDMVAVCQRQRESAEAEATARGTLAGTTGMSYEDLISWAYTNWDSSSELEAVKRAMLANSLEWKAAYGQQWDGPKHFRAIASRLDELRHHAEQKILQPQSLATPSPPPTASIANSPATPLPTGINPAAAAPVTPSTPYQPVNPHSKDLTHLTRLSFTSLVEWAHAHWRSTEELEAVRYAYITTSDRSPAQQDDNWAADGPMARIAQRLSQLRQRAASPAIPLPDCDGIAESTAASRPTAAETPDPGIGQGTAASSAVPTSNISGQQAKPSTELALHSAWERDVAACLEYATLLESAFLARNDLAVLQPLAGKLRSQLSYFVGSVPSGFRPAQLLSAIEDCLRNPSRREIHTPTGEDPDTYLVSSASSNVPGCPEWPEEAELSESAALSANHFAHSTGLLTFMGYHVGQGSPLLPPRRREILQYILLGRLPNVNDRLYMQEWGEPGTDHRLRKLANTLATLARNARRRRSESWHQAIYEWEEDLRFIKQTYYDTHARDWRWPETVRRGTR